MSGALFTLWYALKGPQLARFHTPLLLLEIKRRLYMTPCRNGAETAESLGLIGVGSFFGLDIPPLALSWISDIQVADALAARMPSEAHPELGSWQTQLWLGIREVARRRRKPIRIAPPVGESFRELWNTARPESEKLKRLNVVMIDWLERCARNRWQLLPDQEPLA